jgi:hypothetical protein
MTGSRESSWRGVTRRLFLLAVAVASVLALCGSASARQPLVITAGPSQITIAGYTIRGRPGLPTYQRAIAALGTPDSCDLGAPSVPGLKNFSTVKWSKLGVTMVFGSYGLSPRGGDACSEPAAFYLDNAHISGRAWSTARGLHIGDPVSKLKRLYSSALPHNGTWWIAIAQNRIGTTNLYPVVSVLTAHDRVTAFHFSIGAEGD